MRRGIYALLFVIALALHSAPARAAACDAEWQAFEKVSMGAWVTSLNEGMTYDSEVRALRDDVYGNGWSNIQGLGEKPADPAAAFRKFANSVAAQHPASGPNELQQSALSRAEVCLLYALANEAEVQQRQQQKPRPAKALNGAPATAPSPPRPAQATTNLAPSQDLTKPDEEEQKVLAELDDVLAIPDAPKAPAKPKPKAKPPQLIVAENQGSACLDAHLENVHMTDPPHADPEENSWYYDIVLRNKCAFPVLWYTEWIKEPPSRNTYDSRVGPNFLQGGFTWPGWSPKPAPASPDFQPLEIGPIMPILANETLSMADFYPVTRPPILRIWIVSCNAYAPDGKRAMALFKTQSPLSTDGRSFCAPNVIPFVRY